LFQIMNPGPLLIQAKFQGNISQCQVQTDQAKKVKPRNRKEVY
jgi:hypothetical protein